MGIEPTFASAADNIGILDLYAFIRRKFTKSQVAILTYHRVCPQNDTWSNPPISPQVFEEQMDYFSRNYEIFSLAKLSQYVKMGKRLPEKVVTITFDDGYMDNYYYAYPILNKYHIPATIFLTTGHMEQDKPFWWDRVGFIIQYTGMSHLNFEELGDYSLRSNNDRSIVQRIITAKLKQIPEDRKNSIIATLERIAGVYFPPGLAKELVLSWDKIREMSNNGISFGAHTVNHPILTNMPLQQAQWEIIQSKKDIEQELGKEVDIFSYPNGCFNSDIIKFVKESGFTCAVSVLPGKLIRLSDNIYTFSRIGALEDFKMFKVEICGLWGDIRPVLRRGR